PEPPDTPRRSPPRGARRRLPRQPTSNAVHGANPVTTTSSAPPRRSGRPPGRPTWTRERVLEALTAYYKANGRWPDGTDLCPAKARASGRPHSVEAFDAG